MPTITVGAARIPYRVVGNGPDTLVLVHGTGPGSGMWDGLLDAFTDRYTVLLPDLSGSEAAEDDGAPLTLETLAAQVNAVIEDAGRGPADILGFSLGAVVATAAAALRPDQVRRLIAAAGWISAEQDEYLRLSMATWLSLADRPDAFGGYATLTAFSRGFLNRIGRAAVEANTAYMQPTPGTLRHIALDLSLDLTPLLPRVQAPTLVIGCAQDATVPVENTRRLHAALPGSAYAEFDTGHIVLAEETQAFTKTVRDFLAAA
ncbi:pimeloyl-ACP methyl ester carboxylesterase [Streptomyces sp. 1114.5]|uniref:alpha/beta fold hydrolase n=1 Tax=Streptomyces sp. 1114.5 TaxID=1938830 RepID=UPI000EB35156|nr:alpha/beta hydrolase [Streptomyces sp. 1114.5]RKT16859.1 pimeloyl-ACP methyl ester carboxylesterase [Streptomyces sp. 1114.5]